MVDYYFSFIYRYRNIQRIYAFLNHEQEKAK